MDYKEFEADDLAIDIFFCQWVLSPDIETDKFWMEWLSQNIDRSKYVQQARMLVLVAAMDPGQKPSDEKVDQLWQAILSRTTKYPRNRMFSRIMIIRVAASIVFLLSTFIGYRYFSDSSNTYDTANGEVRRLQLADGTMVTLNANSSLRIPSKWSPIKEREAWLTGEAFFKVTKQQSNGNSVKFIVHTNDVDVEVKGTEFNVNTRQEKTRVILSEGDIQLRLMTKKQKVIQMQPGDLVDFSKAKHKLAKRKVTDTKSWYSWKDNRWTFESTPMSEIAILITETYGFPVFIEQDSILHQKVTGIIPSDNLEDILASLGSILNVRMEQKYNQIRIQPN